MIWRSKGCIGSLQVGRKLLGMHDLHGLCAVGATEAQIKTLGPKGGVEIQEVC